MYSLINPIVLLTLTDGILNGYTINKNDLNQIC